MTKELFYLLSAIWLLAGATAWAADDGGDNEIDDERDNAGSDAEPANVFGSADSELAGGALPATVSFDENLIGGHLLVGGAGMSEDWGDWSDGPLGDVEFRARLAGGLGVFYQHFFSPVVALNAGLDFVGKGYKTEYETTDIKEKGRLRHIEVPVGVRFNIMNIRLGLDLAFSFAVYGEFWRESNEVVDIDGNEETVVREVHFTDSDWDSTRRFNINPRFSAGYAIPFKNVYLIPGLFWEFEMLNTAKGEDRENADVTFRLINLMVTAAVAFRL
ncbi:MAG: outer membrane beta-barrel protein [Deltaproteobacteria bacterium]|nr:outer membrane beta-barrel protein [Deltaproteobacteria bacterium]